MKDKKIFNGYFSDLGRDVDIIINVLKAILLVLLLFVWSYVPTTILKIFGISYKSLEGIYKIIFLFCTDLSLCFVLFFMFKKEIVKDFKKYFSDEFISNFKLSLKYWILGIIVMIVSNFIISIITSGHIANNEEAIRKLINLAPIYMLFDLVIYAPFTEELIFRRGFRNICKNKYIYAIISGGIFGGLHVLTTFKSSIDLLYIIPYSSCGIAFALLYYKSKNIFSSISVHSLHNFLTLILYIVSVKLL